MQESGDFCRTVSDLLLRDEDGDILSDHERGVVDTHLADCAPCRQQQQLQTRAVAALARLPPPVPDAARRRHLRRVVAGRRQRSLVSRWLALPVPAYGAVAASLLVFALAGAFGGGRQTPMSTSLAAVADTSLPTPALTRADSYNVLANLRLLERSVPASAAALASDTLERAALPGAWR